MSVGLAIFLCFIIWLLIVSPGFRMVALAGVAILGVGIFVFLYQQTNKSSKAVSIPPGFELDIPLTKKDIELSEVSFVPSTYDRTRFSFTGKVRNKSQDAVLDSFSVKIVALDCEIKNDTQCDVIGESTNSFYSNVPPNQVRAFENNWVNLRDLPVTKNFRWKYAVEAVNGHYAPGSSKDPYAAYSDHPPKK